MQEITFPVRPLGALLIALVATACSTTTPAAPDEAIGTATSALILTTGLYTTGVDANGGSLPLLPLTVDPHYKLVANAPGLASDPAVKSPDAYAVAPPGAAVVSATTAQWVSINAAANAGTADEFYYTYRTTFDVVATDPKSVVLTGKWACDDTCSIVLNGISVFNNPKAKAYASADSFVIPASSAFKTGTNTLDFVVDNSGGFQTGLLVQEIKSGCLLDTQCMPSYFCDTPTSACAPKIANGKAMPVDTLRAAPFDGKCSSATGAVEAPIVCVSGVCDVADELCGYANGDGLCAANATVCRSLVCDLDGKCGFANGTGPCNPADATSAATVCRSLVCDPDAKCGYANGNGTCTKGAQCRSGTCGSAGICVGAGQCFADADCTAGTQFCNIGLHTCSPKIANNQAMPADTGRTPTAFDGKCTSSTGATEAPIVCVTGVCDVKDELCGFANGDGSCAANAAVCRSLACDPDGKCGYANGNGTCDAGSATVVCRAQVCDPDGKCGYANGNGACSTGSQCRSGTCSASKVCLAAGACDVDTDCNTTTQFCNTGTHVCTLKVDNGKAMPADTGRTPTAFDGKCSSSTGKTEAPIVCTSGVCDSNDELCGYADGDGPCTTNTAGVCRSGICGSGNICVGTGQCFADSDCKTATEFCNLGTHACSPKVENGKAMPTDTGRTPTPFDAKCSSTTGATEAPIVCASAVCDIKDELCGYANGDGTCTTANGATVCRSAVCDPDAKCGFANGNGTCTALTAATVCRTLVCDPDGKCGLANGDGPCTKATGPTVCRSGNCGADGACEAVPACVVDADCTAATQYCAGGTHTCVDKVANGEPMPVDSAHTPALTGSCPVAGASTEAAIACMSGVCDADGKCGLNNGDGPCTAASACRSGACEATDQVCGLLPGDGPCTANDICRNSLCDVTNQVCATACTSDADCPAAAYCAADGACTPKKPTGKACEGNNQCQSADCSSKVCNSVIASGNGVLCTAREAPASGFDSAGIFGLMLAVAGLARRRR